MKIKFRKFNGNGILTKERLPKIPKNDFQRCLGKWLQRRRNFCVDSKGESSSKEIKCKRQYIIHTFFFFFYSNSLSWLNPVYSLSLYVKKIFIQFDNLSFNFIRTVDTQCKLFTPTFVYTVLYGLSTVFPQL